MEAQICLYLKHHGHCPKAETCGECGGAGLSCLAVRSGDCYDNEPPCPCPDLDPCPTCHGLKQTCQHIKCRILDAEVHRLVPVERTCSTCGLNDGEPHEACDIECEDRSHWQPPRYTSDDAPRQVLLDLMAALERLGALADFRFFLADQLDLLPTPMGMGLVCNNGERVVKALQSPARTIVDAVLTAIYTREERLNNED